MGGGRKKAQAVSEAGKKEIIKLYKEDNKILSDVCKLMRENDDHKLVATKAQYKYWLKKWGVRKYKLKKTEKFTVDKDAECQLQGKGGVFIFDGHDMNPHLIEQSERRTVATEFPEPPTGLHDHLDLDIMQPICRLCCAAEFDGQAFSVPSAIGTGVGWRTETADSEVEHHDTQMDLPRTDPSTHTWTNDPLQYGNMFPVHSNIVDDPIGQFQHVLYLQQQALVTDSCYAPVVSTGADEWQFPTDNGMSTCTGSSHPCTYGGEFYDHASAGQSIPPSHAHPDTWTGLKAHSNMYPVNTHESNSYCSLQDQKGLATFAHQFPQDRMDNFQYDPNAAYCRYT
ncbi:hypothetical protein H2201_000891 [Coniosporium apollinis]|uniref:Clr5 domain-containing protein n=1 Tax=Coniosporium apollinis TaxID=61459 RepID=A0ABQ9P3E8_9PEZI|nr:hypothetical protein H2201_000891 [Coniosporium apollinis]